jgi:hemerythrin-like domain-containing protein
MAPIRDIGGASASPEQRLRPGCSSAEPQARIQETPMAHAQSGNSFGRLAASAAIGLAAGLAIPHAKKLAMQAPTLAAGNWVEALTAEHRMVEKLFDQLLATRDDEMVKREMLLTKIAYALNKHAIEEENVIYPALAENALADQSRHLAQEHLEAKTFIYDLRRISSTEPQWLGKASEFWTKLQAHMREEEDEVFPAFRDSLPAEENAKLTAMMNWEGLKVA